MPTSKKNLPRLIENKLALLLVFIVVVLAWAVVMLVKSAPSRNDRASTSTPAQEVSRYEVLRFAADNPYVLLRPTADGRNIDLTAANLETVRRLNLTFTYNAKGVDQGVIERIDLEKDATQSAKRIYLGSCSESTGIRRCYDHAGVTQGTVSAVLDKMRDERNREIKVEFRLIDFKKEAGKLISLDENVQMTVTKGVASLFVIAAPLTGLPKPLSKDAVVGQPYAFLPAKDVALSGTVSFRLPPTAKTQGVTLYRWDERNQLWQPLPTVLKEGIVTSPTDALGIFAAGATPTATP